LISFITKEHITKNNQAESSLSVMFNGRFVTTIIMAANKVCAIFICRKASSIISNFYKNIELLSNYHWCVGKKKQNKLLSNCTTLSTEHKINQSAFCNYFNFLFIVSMCQVFDFHLHTTF
jgi:hypothetical protein